MKRSEEHGMRDSTMPFPLLCIHNNQAWRGYTVVLSRHGANDAVVHISPFCTVVDS